MIKVRKFLLRLFLLGLVFALMALAFIAWTDRAAVSAGEGKLYDQASDLPESRVVLVFGCNKTVQGRPNLYFQYRIEAAAALWREGKAQCFIVSGDNHIHEYNEPQDMKDALVASGVPADKIVCDYAGLRTLDSVVRAKEIFGLTKVTFISQKFHNERAAYLAESIGLDALGLNAQAVTGSAARKVDNREKLARAKMWLDVHLLKTQPRHLGPKEKLPL